MLIAVFAILTAEDINDTIHVTVDYRVRICLSMLINAKLLSKRVVAPWCCGGKLSICATH